MKFFGKFFGIVAVAILMAVLVSFPIMLLWNYVMPDIFGLHEITLLQALAMSFLVRLLFHKGKNE